MPAPRTDFALSASARDLGLRAPGADSPIMELDREVMLAYLASRQLQERLIETGNLLPGLAASWRRRLTRLLLPGREPSVSLAVQDGWLDDVFNVEVRKRGRAIRLLWRDQNPAKAREMLVTALGELEAYLAAEGRQAARLDLELAEGQASRTAAELTEWERRQPSREVPQPRIEREIAARRDVLADLRKRLALMTAEDARHSPRFKTLDPPFLPVKPDRPRPLLYAAAGLALGVCLSQATRLPGLLRGLPRGANAPCGGPGGTSPRRLIRNRRPVPGRE